jgi:hypothetical protein
MTEFGRDISCTDSMRVGRYSTGVRLVAEAAYRRLTTPRGMLLGGEEEADYGFDLSEVIGEVEPNVIAAALPGRISSELTKDERIESVETVVTVTQDGPTTTLLVNIDGTTAEGPFSLQLSVSDVTVDLVGLSTEED